MWRVYGHKKYFYSLSAVIDFRRQNLTSDSGGRTDGQTNKRTDQWKKNVKWILMNDNSLKITE